MKKVFSVLIFLVLAGGLVLAEASLQEDAEESLEESEPLELPRVLGQAQTQDELDAYNAATQATLTTEKIQLAVDFLGQFPDSGLTPYMHKFLAFAHMDGNEFTQFIEHALKALSELPQDPDILPHLARVRSEQGQISEALKLAKSGQLLWETAEKPAGMPLDIWTVKKYQSLADLSYAYGLALLGRSAKLVGDKSKVVKRAIEQLEKAIKADPEFGRAYLRLGSAYAMLNDAGNTLQSFARAANSNSDIAGIAEGRLKKAYELVNKSSDGLMELIQKERDYIQQRMSQRQAELEGLRQQQEEQPELLPPGLPE